MTTRLTTAVLTLGLAVAAWGVEAPGLERLVEQLGDRDFRRRDAAAQQLEAAGVRALPLLRRALTHGDPEVRRRVAGLLPSIETTALLAPRRISLKFDRKPIRDVLDAVANQTGFKIEHWTNNPAQVYSFDFADLPFWEALDRICRDAGLILQPGYGDDRLRLQPQSVYPPFVRYEGPFRFVANGFQLYRNIDFGLVGPGAHLNSRSETLTFTFSVYVEPRLPLLGMGEVKLNAAYDSERNTMLPPVGGGEAPEGLALGGRVGRWVSRYGNGYRTVHLQTQVNLNRPSEKASSVRLLRGTLPVTLLAEQKPVVLTDAVLGAKGKKFSVGSTTFHVEDIAEQPNKQYQLKLAVTEESKDNPNDYTWMNALYQRIELQDAKGTKYQVAGSSWGNSGPNNVQLTLTYAPQGNAGPPAKFIFFAWTTLQHQVSFEFKDLPLP
jgi:hypothetical protein